MNSTTLHASMRHRLTPENKILAAEQTSVRGMLLSLALWLMLWGTYNAEIWRLFEPDFPANALDLFHGLRTLLPFVAAYMAIIMLLARRSIPLRLFQGLLGLLALYTLVGIISSALLSREPLVALYWAAQYAAAFVVLWVILANSNSLSHLSRLINLNWAIVGVIAVGLLAFLLFQPGAISSLVAGAFRARAYAGLFGIPHEMEILGMVGTRPTGFGRWAAVVALVALARLWQGPSRAIWLLLLPFFLFALALSQARTAVIAFLAGASVILWLQSKSKVLLLGGISVVLLLLGFTGFFGSFWAYLTRGAMAFDVTLSGRVTGAWQEGWRLFWESPLLGFGFHADRIFLDQHMHNALLHALVQTGLFGTLPLVAALVGAWILILRLWRARPLQSSLPLPVEIPAVMAFFTVSSVTESTFAFFGVAWLVCAPLFAYVYMMNRNTNMKRRNDA